MLTDDADDISLLEHENLCGLVVAFYDQSKMITDPSHYFFLGHVSENDILSYDHHKITNPIRVTSLDGKYCRYFGLTVGGIWRLLLVDPSEELVVYEKSPVFYYDIVSY
jgi:hypothetical protein